ncbi:RDD family protein [Cohnella endophytica]|uniref:RDD family protein n=1 Tax=Cohnella endophytica TaxID=2419778 RepID=A0A494Y6L7_9BACL|nr:RDD family protein [Cohnella endophytica]RKP57954.1 RDD family protein [Cohnella endophytica]
MDFVAESQTNTTTVKPWSRFWARNFDYLSHSFLIGVIWAFIDMKSLDEINNSILSFLLMASWIVLDGIYMYFFGTTPGKKIMNIKVLHSDGNRLSKSISFKRSRLVWLRGMGLGIGIIEIVANIMGYNRLKKEGITSWDQELDLVIVHEKTSLIRYLICPVCVVGFICLTIYGFM